MSVTANDVFEITLSLAGDLDENGQPEDVDDLKAFAPGIFTTLQAELLKTSVTPITSLDDELEVSDFVAQSILPFGLGAALYKSDETKFVFFSSKYESEKKKIPAVETQILNNYGTT